MQTLNFRGSNDGKFFHFERFQARRPSFWQICEY